MQPVRGTNFNKIHMVGFGNKALRSITGLLLFGDKWVGSYL